VLCNGGPAEGGWWRGDAVSSCEREKLRECAFRWGGEGGGGVGGGGGENALVVCRYGLVVAVLLEPVLFAVSCRLTGRSLLNWEWSKTDSMKRSQVINYHADFLTKQLMFLCSIQHGGLAYLEALPTYHSHIQFELVHIRFCSNAARWAECILYQCLNV
jgi:hypothetical protein